MLRQYEQYLNIYSKNKLLFRVVEPEGNPSIVICIVHGIGEHSGRYNYWSSLFAQKNIAITAIDLKGYGKSSGKPSHSKLSELNNNIETLISQTKNIFPDLPLILYGHDFGGILAVNYFLTKKPEISGLIISSPLFKLSYSVSDFKLIIFKLLIHILPFLSIKNIINPQYLSRKADIGLNYTNDKLVKNEISARLYFEASKLGSNIIGKSYLINIPMLLMHGSADKIAPVKSTNLFVRNTGDFTTLKVWDNCFHELHNELNNFEIFDYILNWLQTNFQII